jgi:TPR repeat protein
MMVRVPRLFTVGLLLCLGASPALGQSASPPRPSLSDLQASAARGDREAQLALGMRYLDARDGAPQDFAEAARWIRRAADQGLADAQYNLALLYQDGRGIRKDDFEAVRWFRRAADQNLAAAQNNLALAYASGKGVAQDETEAARWLRRAADQGDAVAQDNLGTAYIQGRGIEQNPAEAVVWFRRAALQGDAGGMQHLGVCYLQGRGLQPDPARAHLWLTLAIPALDELERSRAVTAVQKLEGAMNPEQIVAATKRAAACRDSGFKACGE